jgi:hypothetical protein
MRQSIRQPGAFLVSGFQNLMPVIYASVSDSDLEDLIAYLETLK